METAILSCRCIDSQPPSSVEALQFSPDGRWLAVGRSSGIVEVFSSVSRHLKLRLSTASCSSVRNIIWLPLTLRAAASSALSEAGGVTTEQTEFNDSTIVSLFEWRLVTTGLHGVITSWNLRTCRVQAECPSNGGAVFSLCRCPPEIGLPSFAAACDDGRVRLLHVSGIADKACREQSDDPYVGVISSDNESTEEIQVTHTLPKTKSRLLSVCWYSRDLIFAGNATSCILRFSRSGPLSAFVADGQMALESKFFTGDSKTDNSPTLVWNLRALRRRSLLLSGDSRGRITLWSLPTCVPLQTLHVHVADVLDMQLMVCIDSLIADGNHSDAQTVKRKEEVVLSVGVDGKLSAISRTEEDRWVVRACRYPHLCDSQALACLPKVPGGPDGSLIVTGAADGSIKWMRNLTELAGLKAPCLPFCLSPALRGLQRPKVIWKKRLLVCPSATEIGIWHIEDGALNSSGAVEDSKSAEPSQSPLIKLAKISLQNQSKINCCDAAKDGQLLAVGSNDGLHLFAFHLKELEIQDLQCLGACRIRGMVTALQFVSRSILACCYFSNKSRKAANYRRLRGVARSAESVSTSESVGSGAAENTQKSRGRAENESCSSVTPKKWICKEVPCLREAEALPDRLGETDGTFCLSFIKVSTGTELASVRDLPFPVVHMDLSPDGKKLGCLNSNSSIFVFDVESLELMYFLPNIFRRGENVASFCFSPDSARLFVLGTRNGYFLTDVNEFDSSLAKSDENNRGEAKTDTKNNKRLQKQRRNVRSIPARLLSREDGSIVHCKWVEDERTAYVLCMTPSSLYKLSLDDVTSSMDVENRPQKKPGGEIRLLNLSSDSEEDRDYQDSSCSSQARSVPRQLKKLRGQRPVIISPAPAYAAPFCVPRVLPASLSRQDNNEDLRFLWNSQGSPSGATPGGTDSTRSTATTPGDSPVSHQRADKEATAEVSNKKRMFNSITRTARLLRLSDNKGFVGFALEKCDGQTAAKMLPCPNGPCSRALVLLEVLNTGAPNESSLPPFNRKRYGT